MFSVDLIAALAGMVIPPAFDFVKKKFIKSESDTPERTLGTLATTKPEVLAGYIDSLARLKEADIKFFNRDVVGTPSQWIIDLRSGIRPCVVVMSICVMVGSVVFGIQIEEGIRIPCSTYVGAWMTSRNL